MTPFANDSLTAVPGLRVGHAEVEGGRSGCTVVLGPFRGAVETPGLATGTRELGTLSPTHLVSRVDAVLLSGGSAFGLAAADGVMEWLERQGAGFDTGVGKVPLVPAAVVFDLDPQVPRPTAREGLAACEAAHRAGSGTPVPAGRVGAGAGARVGKLAGSEASMSGGLGGAALEAGSWTVGALSVVNAVGEIRNRNGRIVAGARGAGGQFLGGDEMALKALGGARAGLDRPGPMPGTNTTLAVVATDAPLGKADLARVARVAATAFSRRISPVHTPFDGDVLFMLSTAPDPGGTPETWTEPPAMNPAMILALGVAAREALETAILRAVDA